MAGRPGRLKWVRRILCAAGLLILVTGVTLWLMFQHIPSWYRPPAIAPANHQRIRNDWAGSRDSLQQAMLREEPFEFAVTQDQINSWLAIREAIWQLSREWLPSALSEPFVRIEKDSLRLAATYRSGSIRTVLSARLEIALRADGIWVRLAGLDAGSLGVPDAWVRERLRLIDGRAWSPGKKSRYQLGGPPLPSLPTLPDGAVFPATWVWKESELALPFEIAGLRFEPGVLVVSLRPLPR
ncbi:MAG TPA: hypothetical protein PLL20_08295 [Phycisphaerae bacterium]|nr:hypothetical protein [Phycisphaerae bacterium]HRR85399.1 hypothetical protein [Phycisphaerae bacterium]